MKPGLKQEQLAAAEKWINSSIDDSVAYLTTPHKYASVNEEDQAKLAAQSKPFFAKVADIIARTQGDDEKRKRSLDDLKAASLNAMKEGEPTKGFLEIAKEGFKLNPVSLLGEGIAAAFTGGSFLDTVSHAFRTALVNSVKDAAIAYGGDAAAPWLKSMKNTYFDGKPKTTEQAALELSAENGARALARVVGVDVTQDPAFVAEVVSSVERLRQGDVSAAPASPAAQPDQPKQESKPQGQEIVRAPATDNPGLPPALPGAEPSSHPDLMPANVFANPLLTNAPPPPTPNEGIAGARAK